MKLRRARTRSGAPQCESLERRALLNAIPQGPEFRANTFTTGNQFSGAVAMDNLGNFVVVWQSVLQDGGTDGIYGQRYDSTGAPLGVEFRVNETTAGNQQTPTVAMDNDGDFVVAWNSIDQGGINGEIWARRFTNAGVPAPEGEFHVNMATIGGQNTPAAAMDGAGNFVITWISPSSSYEIFARRYNASGTALADEFQVNTDSVGNQLNQAVAMDTDGDFVITWQSSQGDGNNTGVFARRFDQTGMGFPQFLVNQTTTNAQRVPAVAVDNAGNFVIAWESNLQDGSLYGVYARRYSAAGTALADEFRVNSSTTEQQRAPAVAMDDSGDFVIAWQSRLQDGSLYGVYAQVYDAAGVVQGGEFKVNTHTTNSQLNPAAAFDADGDFIITWQSDQQEGALSGFGVYAQRYGTSSTPEVITATFVWQNAPQRIVYTFTQNVTVEPGDILLENLTTMQTVPTANIAVTPGPNTATITFLNYPFGALPDGQYRATLRAADVVPPLPSDRVDFFQFLMADSDQNGVVNLQDFNRLAGNFGQSGRDFTQGNFNYDPMGLVNLQDFNLLAGRFGATVAPAVSVRGSIGAPTPGARRTPNDDRDRMIGVVG
jgi:hypothetical protein